MTANENHPLPELHEGLLDNAGLAALIRDIGTLGEGLEVVTKGGQVARATPGPVSLDEAHDRLRGRELRAVQFRYRFDKDEWWDTVTAVPNGFKLVRIRQDWSTRA